MGNKLKKMSARLPSKYALHFCVWNMWEAVVFMSTTVVQTVWYNFIFVKKHLNRVSLPYTKVHGLLRANKYKTQKSKTANIQDRNAYK